MHRTRTLIVALVLLVLLAVAAWLVLRPQAEEPAPVEEAADTTLYSVDSGAITGLSWTWGETSLSLVREDGDWICGNAPEIAIDQMAASQLAALASSVSYTKSLDETAQPAEFGFDQPSLTLHLYLGEATATLELGMRNEFAGGDYARYQNGGIYLIDMALYDAFAVGLQDLVPQDQLPTPSSVSDIWEVELTTAEKSRTIYQMTEDASPSDFYTWFEATDGEKDAALDASATRSALAKLTNLQFADCVAFRPDDLAVYGLEDPTLRVRMFSRYTDTTGATQEQTMLLCFGDATEPEVLLGETEDLDELEETEEEPQRFVYVQMDGSDLVYTMDEAVLESLLEAIDTSLVPTAVCQVDWGTLRVMRVTANGTTTRLGIDSIEDMDADGEVKTTKVYSVDGRDVEYGDVYEVFSQIRFMETESILTPAEPVGEPYVTVEFHRDSDVNTVVVVNLYPYDNSFYLVEADGLTQLLVSRRDVQTLIDMTQTLREGGTLIEEEDTAAAQP